MAKQGRRRRCVITEGIYINLLHTQVGFSKSSEEESPSDEEKDEKPKLLFRPKFIPK